jgi:ferredoxin-type protein NapH
MKKFTIARGITLTAVAVIVLIGLFVNTGFGTPSSFGWEAIAYICPLGVIETFLASGTILPRPLIALVVCVAVAIVVGKVFCAWVCPVPPLRRFFTFEKKDDKRKACNIEEKDLRACSSGCTSCAEKRKRFDSRHIVLGGALLSTAIFGFPVFCIVCPVGLTFASLIALWRLVGFNEPSWALLIFPLFLVLELFVLKKWCLKFCPLGALMSLMSIPNRLLRPRVDSTRCLREQGIECSRCVSVCEENLDSHFSEGMHECTKCGLCIENCPAQAIKMVLLPRSSRRIGRKNRAKR